MIINHTIITKRLLHIVLFSFAIIHLIDSNSLNAQPNQQMNYLDRLDSLETELQNMKTEITTISHVKNWVSNITVLVAGGTLLFGIFQYRDKKIQDYKRQIWEERKLLYFKVIEATSQIAITENINDTKEARYIFWSLYWGKLALLEDSEVEEAMINFGGELKKEDSNLKSLSYKLALACRNSLKKTWEPVKLDKLKPDRRNWDLTVTKGANKGST